EEFRTLHRTFRLDFPARFREFRCRLRSREQVQPPRPLPRECPAQSRARIRKRQERATDADVLLPYETARLARRSVELSDTADIPGPRHRRTAKALHLRRELRTLFDGAEAEIEACRVLELRRKERRTAGAAETSRDLGAASANPHIDLWLTVKLK